MMISETSSNKIANLSFFSVVLVVLGHVKWLMVGGVWTDFGGIAHSASRAILPFFFCVSGYFLARHVGERGWWRTAVIKRIRTLIVPFLAWTVLYVGEMFIVDVLLNLQAGHGAFAGLRGVWGDVRAFFGLSPFHQPALAPLWYVRNLFLLVLVSPILLVLVNRFRLRWLLVLTGLHIGVLCAFCLGLLSFVRGPGAVLSGCFSSEGLIYFSVGIFCARNPVSAPKGFLASSGAVALAWGLVFALLLVPVVCPATVRWAYLMEGLSMPILAYAAWCSVSSAKWPSWITAAAFPLYLMHPVLFDVGYGVAKVIGAEVYSALFCWELFGVTVVCSVALAALLRRLCRPLSGILFGGR